MGHIHIPPELMPGLMGLGLSALACALVLAAAGLIGLLAEAPSLPRAGVALALGVAYILGHAAVREWLPPRGRPPLPPLDAFDWIPWLALAATILGVLESVAPSPVWARWENRLILTGAALWLLLGPLFQGTWAPREGASWLGGLGVGILASWSLLEGRAEHLGRAAIFPLLILAAGTSGVLLISHTLILAELSAALAAALGVTWVASWFSPHSSLGRGGIPVVTVVLAGLLLWGYFYNEVPAPSALLLALAPLATWVDRIGPVGRLAGWKAAVIRALAVLVPVGIAVGVALLRAPEPAEAY